MNNSKLKTFWLKLKDRRTFLMLKFGDQVYKSEIINDFTPLTNTRFKEPHESCLEIDTLSLEKSREIIFKTAKKLKQKNIPHRIYFAEGQRSPHLRVWGDESLSKLSEPQRVEAQKLFWESVMPKDTIQFADKSMWLDKKEWQLEHALHHKTHNYFNLEEEYNGVS